MDKTLNTLLKRKSMYLLSLPCTT